MALRIQSGARRHQEAPALQHRDRGFALSPRDGRFIEKIGFYNPLLPSDHADRLKLDLDEAKAWIAKGAIASDRVHSFLANAGLVKARVHNNPKKAQPKKKAQERAAAAAKAAEEASA